MFQCRLEHGLSAVSANISNLILYGDLNYYLGYLSFKGHAIIFSLVRNEV